MAVGLRPTAILLFYPLITLLIGAFVNRVSIEGTAYANTFFHFTVSAATDCDDEAVESTISIELKLASADIMLAQFGNIPAGHNP